MRFLCWLAGLGLVWSVSGETRYDVTRFGAQGDGVTLAAAGVTRRGFYFRLYPGAIRAAQLIHFPGHLQRQVRGKIRRVWDRLGVHRSRAVRAWFRRQADRWVVEELPAYAPELNPVEYLWGWWKPHTVANGCARTEEELHWLVRQGLRQAQRRKATLVAAFWKQADLSF